MSLAEHLTQPTQACKYTRLRDTLTDDDRRTLDTAMGNPAFSSVHIARALRAEGHQLSEDSVRRHRTGACACP